MIISLANLGLRDGDRLKHIRKNTVAVVVRQDRGVRVRPEGDGAMKPCGLFQMTYDLKIEPDMVAVDVYAVWTFEGETLRARYERIVASQPKPGAPAEVSRSRWIKDMRAEGNLFLLAACIRFTDNLCRNFKGAFDDSDIFAPVAMMMSRAKANHLFHACTTAPVRTELECREYGRIKNPDDEAVQNLLNALWAHPKSNPKFRRALREWLAVAAEKLALWQKAAPDPAQARFRELRRVFTLDDREADLLLALSAVQTSLWPCSDFKERLTHKKIRKMAALLGVEEPSYLAIIKEKSKLRRLDCVEDDGDLNASLQAFILGLTDKPLDSRYFKRHEGETLPWPFFGPLADKHGAFLKRLIASRPAGRSLNILLHGEPGTGKTSFALALAAELGLTPYLIAQANEHAHSSDKMFRIAALQVCDGQVDREKSLIIIDEANRILDMEREGGMAAFVMRASGTPLDKGVLNDILETVQTPCVWITNSQAESLDPSNRRRFDYSVRFDKLTRKQREMIWRNTVAKHGVGGVLPDEMIAGLVARYEVSAGGIDLAVRNLGMMLQAGRVSAAEAGEALERVLAPHCELLEIRENAAARLGRDYSLAGLNIRGDIPLPQIEAAIRRYRDEQRAGKSGSADSPRMNLLLSGPPGTGKTEFVKYLGAALDAPVVTRMGSDLLSMWVGGSEKNIKRAFEEAAAERAILFLDEVDGLMQSRERANRSWEVTQVNELLHQMENFDGVLVCATNFADNLDQASLRRFTFKLTFDCLNEEGKLLFFSRMFASFGAPGLSPDEAHRLTHIPNLTPGDFRTVRQGAYYLSGAATVPQLLSALERESEAKRGRTASAGIGFRPG